MLNQMTANQAAQTSLGQTGMIAPPRVPSLELIRQLIGQIALNIGDIHGIADRACGHTEPRAAQQTATDPNGMLDEIEQVLSSLVEASSSAVSRLSRIA